MVNYVDLDNLIVSFCDCRFTSFGSAIEHKNHRTANDHAVQRIWRNRVFIMYSAIVVRSVFGTDSLTMRCNPFYVNKMNTRQYNCIYLCR